VVMEREAMWMVLEEVLEGVLEEVLVEVVQEDLACPRLTGIQSLTLDSQPWDSQVMHKPQWKHTRGVNRFIKKNMSIL